MNSGLQTSKKPARTKMHAGFLRLQDSNGLQGAFLPVGA